MSENDKTVEQIAARLQAEQTVQQTCRVQIIAAASALPMYEGIKGGTSEFAHHFLPSSLLDAATNRMMKTITDGSLINQQAADRTLRDLMVQEGVGSLCVDRTESWD